MKKIYLATAHRNIHQIEDQHEKRMISFRGDTQYAVVLASYYTRSGGRGYTTHNTYDGVERACRKNKNYSYCIIDRDGQYIARVYPGEFAKTGDYVNLAD